MTHQAKVLWIDLETTGVNHLCHGITQLAALVEIDGEIIEEANLRMSPMLTHEISAEALEKQHVTEDEIRTYPHPSDQFTKFKALLQRYVNRYDKLDKFTLAGYNINSFDEPFLRQWFLDNSATRKDRQYGGYFGSYFFWPKRDVQTYVAEHITERGMRLDNYQLETVCAMFAIDITAHDALSDIHATRNLYRVLRYSLSTAAAKAA